MGKSRSYNRRSMLVILRLSLTLVGLALTAAVELHAAENTRTITPSGQRIESIFDGLSPSRFALEYRFEWPRPKGMHGLIEGKDIDEIFGANFVRVQCQCPSDTSCAGHFEVLTPCSGCCLNPTGCQGVNNFHSDTQNGSYSEGVYDSFCGVDCCTDANGCDSP